MTPHRKKNITLKSKMRHFSNLMPKN